MLLLVSLGKRGLHKLRYEFGSSNTWNYLGNGVLSTLYEKNLVMESDEQSIPAYKNATLRNTGLLFMPILKNAL